MNIASEINGVSYDTIGRNSYMPSTAGISPERLGTRLESWKQIAGHVNRHVTTVRRWERQEGLPVHRHAHSSLSSVYAYTAELDAWLAGRQPEQAATLRARAVAPEGAKHCEHPLAPPSNSALPGRIPLLGRDSQLETLQRAWRTALTGQQQIVRIVGDAGQGKTRLTQEFAGSIADHCSVLTGG